MSRTKHATNVSQKEVEYLPLLPDMSLGDGIETIRIALALRAHLVEARATQKVQRIESVIGRWLMRIAAVVSPTQPDASLKATFLTADLKWFDFSLPTSERMMVDAALSFEANQYRRAKSNNATPTAVSVAAIPESSGVARLTHHGRNPGHRVGRALTAVHDRINCDRLTAADIVANDSAIIAAKALVVPCAASKMSLPRLVGLAQQVDRDIEFLFANGALSAASDACTVANHLAMILACVSPRDRREAELRLRVLGEHRSAFQTESVLTAMFDAAIARDCMEWNFTVIDATRGPTTTH